VTTDPIERLVERHPTLSPIAGDVQAALGVLEKAFTGGRTVYVCGNGGSAGDADHIVGELMKGMCRARPLPAAERAALASAAPAGMEQDVAYLTERLDGALPAVCLSSQIGLLTAVANDVAGDMGFAQQVYGYGRPGDVLWAISTSGRSRNVVLATLAARARSMPVIALTGHSGQPLAALAEVAIAVPCADVGAAQELHRPVYHAICQGLEDRFFPTGA